MDFNSSIRAVGQYVQCTACMRALAIYIAGYRARPVRGPAGGPNARRDRSREIDGRYRIPACRHVFSRTSCNSRFTKMGTHVRSRRRHLQLCTAHTLYMYVLLNRTQACFTALARTFFDNEFDQRDRSSSAIM